MKLIQNIELFPKIYKIYSKINYMRFDINELNLD